MKLQYVQGNLLEAKERFIIHGCNSKGVMGSGVAKAIRAKWPKAYTQYRAMCEAYNFDARVLGGLTPIVKVDDDHYVGNMITQDGYGTEERQLNYDFLYKGFDSDAVRQNVDCFGGCAIPFIGCGLGGGSWTVVKSIIEWIYRNDDVTFSVYYLTEEEKDKML